MYKIEKRYKYEYPSKAIQEYHNLKHDAPLKKWLIGYDLFKGETLMCKGVIIATWNDVYGKMDYRALCNDEDIRNIKFEELKNLEIHDIRLDPEYEKEILLEKKVFGGQNV
ncbi:MAG: hypothetical protein RSB50_06185 [Cetobacterium sp.]